MTKRPNPVDVHVGARVRLRRLLLSMSQEKLGEQLGLTFQQVQKYEKGVNRIGASRLHQIATILQVPVSFFFEDMPTENGAETAEFADSASSTYVLDLINSSDGLQLVKAFLEIDDPAVRRRVVDLVRAISESDGDSLGA
ncbi:MAG: helix-turn-helix domain-containing protein [Pseudomonadota bacterium]